MRPSPSISLSEGPILMTAISALIETSFADAIEIIAKAYELPEQTRRHWTTSLQQIAKALDKPLEVIPARYSAVRADLINRHQVPAGLTLKTLQNHKSNTKRALLWLAREKGIPEHGAPLRPDWGALRRQIRDSLVRARLSSLMRYSSANQIMPSEVDEAVIDRFMEYRSHCGMPADHTFRRLMARAWNSNVGFVRGWPTRRLFEPPVKTKIEISLEEFREGLLRDIDVYLQSLTRVRRSRTGQRIRPLKASTISTRRAELIASARMAVKAGVPIESLNSLSALLAPDVAEKILDAYWRRAPEAGVRTREGCSNGADRGSHCNLNGGAGAPCQPDGDQARHEPDQAGGPAVELLACFSGLRCQEPSQAGIPIRAISHAIDRRICFRVSAHATARQE